jgi:hypothetical protein
MTEATPAAAPAAPAAAPAAGSPPAEAPASWFAGADADTVGYIQNRGLDKLTPDKAALKTIEFHRNAEKLLGAGVDNLVRLPKDANDAAGRDALYKRLGRPDNANGYDLTGIEAGEDFLKFAPGMFHKLGFSNEQAREWTKAAVAEATRIQTEQETAASAAHTVEKDALLKDWGGAANANLIVAQNAYTKLGLTTEQVDAIEKQIGFAKTMQMFYGIGVKTGEHNFVNPDNPGGSAPRITSKEQARSRINDLKKDKEYTKSWLAGDTAKVKEMHDLHALLASE